MCQAGNEFEHRWYTLPPLGALLPSDRTIIEIQLLIVTVDCGAGWAPLWRVTLIMVICVIITMAIDLPPPHHGTCGHRYCQRVSPGDYGLHPRRCGPDQHHNMSANSGQCWRHVSYTCDTRVVCHMSHMWPDVRASRLFRSEGKTLSLRVTTSSFLNISNPNLSAQLFIFLYLLIPQLTLALVQFDRYWHIILNIGL